MSYPHNIAIQAEKVKEFVTIHFFHVEPIDHTDSTLRSMSTFITSTTPAISVRLVKDECAKISVGSSDMTSKGYQA